MEKAEVEQQLMIAFHQRRMRLITGWVLAYGTSLPGRCRSIAEVHRDMDAFATMIRQCNDAQVALLDMLGESE